MKTLWSSLAKFLCWFSSFYVLLILLLITLILLALFPGLARIWLFIFLALLCVIGLVVFAICLSRFLKRICKKLSKPPPNSIKNKKGPTKKKIPSHTYRRPDPMIYSQYYLMSQGIGITWDNPDIQLELPDKTDPSKSNPVPASSFAAATEYVIVANIWNGSSNAPAVNVPVRFSYLTFGIGTVKTFIGETTVNLPVKGADDLPALAKMKWTTPATPGHYCLQVEPFWFDDANPANNLGQENINVKPLNSPHASFSFPVRNEQRFTRRLRLEVDAYTIPSPAVCSTELADYPEISSAELERSRRLLLASQGKGQHPIPEGWTVEVTPDQFPLAPGEEQIVVVEITAIDSFVGMQAINVNAYDEFKLVGGVTLYVTGNA